MIGKVWLPMQYRPPRSQVWPRKEVITRRLLFKHSFQSLIPFSMPYMQETHSPTSNNQQQKTSWKGVPFVIRGKVGGKEPNRLLRMQAASSVFHSRLVSTERSSLNLFALLVPAQHGIPLRLLPLQLALPSGLGPGTLGVHLFLDLPLAGLLCLGAVDLQPSSVNVEYTLKG